MHTKSSRWGNPKDWLRSGVSSLAAPVDMARIRCHVEMRALSSREHDHLHENTRTYAERDRGHISF